MSDLEDGRTFWAPCAVVGVLFSAVGGVDELRLVMLERRRSHGLAP